MTLIRIPLELVATPIDASVEALIKDAEDRIDLFLRERQHRPIASFVPSDFRDAYRALQLIQNKDLATGNSFLEWGSGFGVVTILASLLDFESYGIEMEQELVQESELLAEDFGSPACFARGSFIPEGGEAATDSVGDFDWLSSGGRAGYDELDMEPDDFDLIYAYPWPGEEQVTRDLFSNSAPNGALLLTYHGMEDLELHRQQIDPDERMDRR